MPISMTDELFTRLKKTALVSADGIAYSDFRKQLTPKWRRVWLDIVLGWAAILGLGIVIAALAGTSPGVDIALVVLGSIMFGFLIAYLQLFLHEGAHFNLHPAPDTNDLLCNVFVSGIVGQDVRLYRPIHWEHHRSLGTTMDTEISYFDPLNIQFLFKGLTGIRALKVVLFRREQLRKERKPANGDSPGGWPAVAVCGLLVNFIYAAVLAYFHQWVLLLAWAGGVLLLFPFFGALRQLLEHRSAEADPHIRYREIDHGAVHRLFGDGPIASTFGAAGFNRHLLHHWDPDLSYTRLGDLERYLMTTPAASYLQHCRTTYWGTLCRLFQVRWR